MEFYPMWRLKFARDEARMQARWPGARRSGWNGEIDTVLRHVADNSPTCSLDVSGEEKKNSSGWWDWHPSKTALEFLWRSGRLAMCHREGFWKFYDLSERVIPAEHLNIHRADADIIDWAMREALQSLGFATSGKMAAFFEIATRDETKTWCNEAMAAGRIIEADVEMSDGSRRRCYTTEAKLKRVSSLQEPASRVRILSPFDPLLRDRSRAERLFGFYYRIEIFVPEAKRRYGYYVFPVLQGDRLISRLDPKRNGKVLRIRAFWPEADTRMGKARTAGLISELERLKYLAGAETVDFEEDWVRPVS